MIELDVISYLNSDAILDTLLGANGDSKIYPIQMPQGASAPFIIYRTSVDGTLDENLKEMAMEFDCIDDSFNTAKNIRDRVSVLLDYQYAIRDYITSASYFLYWAKKIGGNTFKDSELDLFHHVLTCGFKYQIK